MITAISRIGAYTQGLDRGLFVADGLIQDAVIRNLEIMGEASLARALEHSMKSP